jgi:hypothetical protein
VYYAYDSCVYALFCTRLFCLCTLLHKSGAQETWLPATPNTCSDFVLLSQAWRVSKNTLGTHQEHIRWLPATPDFVLLSQAWRVSCSPAGTSFARLSRASLGLHEPRDQWPQEADLLPLLLQSQLEWRSGAAGIRVLVQVTGDSGGGGTAVG